MFLSSYILSSNKKYFNRFTEIDMRARNIETISDYLPIIYNSCSEFTEKQKKKLVKAVKIVDKFLLELDDKNEYFDGKKASRVRWNIGCIRGKKYEGGYPHTVKNVIVLPKRELKYGIKKLVRLLIHEKIHVYQRKYKNDMKKYLKNNHFVVTKNHKRYQSNPDTDGKTYRLGKRIYQCLYRTENMILI